MNNYRIKVQAEWRPETLERILRVIRHRGFIATSLSSELISQQLQLDISLSSERELPLLTNQLAKLYVITNIVVLND